MDDQTKTKGAEKIEQLMQQLPPDSERYQVLDSARRFKSSWLELGEWLARVANGSQFQQWGYTCFEDYCSREIRIRRQTAEKLLLAYRFMEREEPRLLEQRAERPLPDYRSIDLLRQAQEEQSFAPAEYQELRRTVIDEERSHPTVARQFQQFAQTHQPEQQQARREKAALSAARRLATNLQELADVPEEMLKAVDGLIVYLQDRVEEESAED